MTTRLETLLGYLQSANTRKALQTAIERVRDHFDVLHSVYDWVNSAGAPVSAGTYSRAWVEHYMAQDYRRMDPVIFGCFQRFTPVSWKELDWSSKPAQAMWRDARAHGLGNQGYTVPVRGPAGQFALFSLNTDAGDEAWAAFIDRNAQGLMILAHEFNRKALELEQGNAPAAPPGLSPRERAAIRCLAQGFSRVQAAREMGISEHTLRGYIESARHKLGALNTTHAVALALSAGVIIV